MASGGVLAVVVTFHPSMARLLALLQTLMGQGAIVLVVDNTPDAVDWSGVNALGDATHQPRVHRMGYNAGIAAAQNVGIACAIEEHFKFVLLSDQDSLPAPDMIINLLSITSELSAQGIRVGCVCPAYLDETTGQELSFQVQRPEHCFYHTIPAAQADPWCEIITTISSGSLIPVATLREVGKMREDFFIDHVDTEWCHRARASGFRLFGTCHAELRHRLGDAPFMVWYFGWREHSEYSPTRLYYRFRNFVRMIRMLHVPNCWAVRASWYWLGNLYAHCIFSPNRIANLRAILLGLWDGLLGRGGSLQREI